VRNLAVYYLKKHKECLEDYDGICGDLVDGIIHWLGERRVQILYIKPRFEMNEALNDMWRYHMVAVIDGKVHDAWFPKLILPPEEYAKEAFWSGRPVLSLMPREE